VARLLRVTPFAYYSDLLADSMREDAPYDALPNLAAADAVRVVGVGRNEYIAAVQAAKSKRLLWRVNRGAVREMLPQAPRDPAPEGWWLAHVVNVGEVEFRMLGEGEVAAARLAARPGGAPCALLDGPTLASLHRRGLVWLEVPVAEGDQLSIPPLEVRCPRFVFFLSSPCFWVQRQDWLGCACPRAPFALKTSCASLEPARAALPAPRAQGFVSNKSAAAGDGSSTDPIEGLLYQVFVAASDAVTVSTLASILSVDVGTLRTAISLACRLGFCRKLPPAGAAAALATPAASPGGPAPASLDLDSVLHSAGAEPPSPAGGTPRGGGGEGLAAASPSSAAGAGAGAAGGVALVVDSEVTGYLMMGALTPGCKRHAVTLFEGGRVCGADVVAELISELRASAAAALEAGFEGEMAALASYAASLAAALDCARAAAGGRPVELLRKESVGSLAPAAARRILAHSYSVVLPIASLPFPPLPLPPALPGPTNYGPSLAAATPWAQLALYGAAGCGPRSLVLPAGRRLLRLPLALAGGGGALVWPWDCRAVRAARCAPAAVPAASLLAALNKYLARTAVMVQPLRRPVESDGDSGALGAAAGMATVDVPLPLPSPPPPGAAASAAEEPSRSHSRASSGGSGWANFESAEAAPAEPSAAASAHVEVTAFAADGAAERVTLPAGCASGLRRLGLGGAVGVLRLLREPGAAAWVPLQLTLGLPLQPPELCEAACRAAAAAGFLTPAACAAHAQGQRALEAALLALAAPHAPHPDGAGAAAVPAHAFEVDAQGRVRRAALEGAVQGPAGLLG
jgi:hypothetical protein